jgi:hypothetical protein
MKLFALTTIRNPQDTDERLECWTVGVFEARESAVGILNSNYGGIDESGYYRYAVIEEIVTGLYPPAKNPMFYEFVSDISRWVEADDIYLKHPSHKERGFFLQRGNFKC